VAAEFDQDWSQQKHPDPRVPPRSIAVRSRVEEHYTAFASDGDMRVDEYRLKLFPVFSDSVHVALQAEGSQEGTAAPSTTTASPAGCRSAPCEGPGSSPEPASSEVPASSFDSAGDALQQVAKTGLEESVPVVLLALIISVLALCMCNTIEVCRLRRKGAFSNIPRATVVGHSPVTDSEAARLEMADL